ncbi:unnamed protein product, partial [Phaeothamnion confervicola]
AHRLHTSRDLHTLDMLIDRHNSHLCNIAAELGIEMTSADLAQVLVRPVEQAHQSGTVAAGMAGTAVAGESGRSPGKIIEQHHGLFASRRSARESGADLSSVEQSRGPLTLRFGFSAAALFSGQRDPAFRQWR